jgi:hypothetical protein
MSHAAGRVAEALLQGCRLTSCRHKVRMHECDCPANSGNCNCPAGTTCAARDFPPLELRILTAHLIRYAGR